MKMKLRYRLFLRCKSVYYAFDDTTKTFTSLKTKDKAEANRLLMAMNEAGKQPAMNLAYGQNIHPRQKGLHGAKVLIENLPRCSDTRGQ